MLVLIATIFGLSGAVVARWGLFACLAVLDGFRQRVARVVPSDIESITVVIPAWNEAAVIERTVRSALASDLEVVVIVVDDGSTDETARVAAVDERVVVLVQPENQGKAAALNRGLQHAKSRLVLTLDADTLLASDAARWLVATQRATGATAVAANVRVGNRGLLPRMQSLEYVAGLNLDRRALNQLGVITTVPGAAALWVRESVLAVGGFSGDTLAEDTDLSISLLRAGHQLVYQDRADAFTEAPQTPWGLWRQRRRWLTGNLACVFKHGWRGPARLRWIGLPNFWFAHLGVYLLPWVVGALVALVPPHSVAGGLALIGTTALVLDLGCLIGAYAWDRADPRDLIAAPFQRLVWPWFALGVFASVWVAPPRSWAKITRRNTALLPKA